MFWDGILDSDDPRWMKILRQMPHYDFHHLPGYVSLEAERRSSRACAYVFQSDQGSFLVPLLLAPVPITLDPMVATFSDALAPYGYASPLICAEGTPVQQADFVTLALTRLIEHLRCRKVCAILLRFHPLITIPLEPFQNLGRLILHGETVYIDLRQSLEEMWSETRQGIRNPINRMQREGFCFELDQTAQHYDEFMNIYHDTMLRVRAEPQYLFSNEFLQGFRQVLGEGFTLAHVRSPGGEIVSSGIFTQCTGLLQYHLSGNSLGKDGSDGSKLLLHGIRSWAHEQGWEKFHLGGGVGAKNDSLFMFKSGFSSKRAHFYTWRMVIDDAGYNHLCRQWERRNHSASDPLKGFFPAYRKMPPFPEASPTRKSA